MNNYNYSVMFSLSSAATEYSGMPIGLSAPVHVSHTGDLVWFSAVIIKSYCKMKVKYFPFDEQFCSIKLSSWSYNETEVKLVLAEDVAKTRMNYSGKRYSNYEELSLNGHLNTRNKHTIFITTRNYRKLYISYTMLLQTYGSNTEQVSLSQVLPVLLHL